MVNEISEQHTSSRDTITLKYLDGKDYKVIAYRKTSFHPFIAFIRGYRNQIDSDSVIVQSPFCKMDVGIKAVRGDSVTFINRSNGIKSGVRYSWYFNDNKPEIGKADSIVTHVYDDISKAEKITLILIPLVDGCKADTIELFLRDSDTAILPVNIDQPIRPVLEQQVQRAKWLPWALSALLTLLSSGIWWWRKRNRKSYLTKPEPINSKPPFILRLPSQQSFIKPSPSLFQWAGQLQQREDGQRRLVDILRTIKDTIRQGGRLALHFRHNRQRPAYLVLIDTLSARDQQAQFYSYLMDWLLQSEVEVETFRFNADPRQCWNAKYPNGVHINELAQSFSDRQLVIMTEGTRLLDYDTHGVAQWVKVALSSWTYRAILTPVYPENWNYVEMLLSKFFVVLPTSPAGQLLLRDYLQGQSLPTFIKVRDKLGVNIESGSGRGIFEKTVEEITIDDIDTFLKQSIFKQEALANNNHLMWWAYATAVYPTTAWEVTLRIGRAIEEKFSPSHPIVTTNHLLKLTSLPWLKQGHIPPKLTQALLAKLPIDVEQMARTAVKELLESQKLTDLPNDSIASQERVVGLNEQLAHSLNEDTRQQALLKLKSFEQAGLVKDKQIIQHFKEQQQKQKKKQLNWDIFLASVLMILIGIPFIIDSMFPSRPQPVVQGIRSYFYKPILVPVDSSIAIPGNVNLWDEQGQLIATFYNEANITSAVFSPNDSQILTASADSTAKLWDRNGKLLVILSHKRDVNSAVFSPDGSQILTASDDNTAKLWDRSGKLLAILNHTDYVISAVFSPNGSQILTASADSTAKLWDRSGKLLVILSHKRDVNSAVFSPDGSQILTASDDNTAKLWDRSGKLLAILNHTDYVISAVFSPNGSQILTASADSTAKLWDKSRKLLVILSHKRDVNSAVFSPDGSQILTASDDNTAKLWDRNGKLLVILNHTAYVISAVFSLDGSHILTASRDGTAKLWNRRGKLLATLSHKNNVVSAVFSSDGSQILTASGNRLILEVITDFYKGADTTKIDSVPEKDLDSTIISFPPYSRTIAVSGGRFSNLPADEAAFPQRTDYTFTPFTLPIQGEDLMLKGILCQPKNRTDYFNTPEPPPTKQRIVLHFNSGNLTAGISSLTTQNRHVSAPFVIARDGTIFHLFPSKYWSGAIGAGLGNVNTNNEQDKITISIELMNYGYLVERNGMLETIYSRPPENPNRVDFYCPLTQTDAYQKLSTPFRGQSYFATFTPQQYNSLIVLLRFLTTKHNIPRQFLPESKRYIATSDVLTFKGIVSHINYRESGKWDIGPAFDWKQVIDGVQAASYSSIFK